MMKIGTDKSSRRVKIQNGVIVSIVSIVSVKFNALVHGVLVLETPGICKKKIKKMSKTLHPDEYGSTLHISIFVHSTTPV